jgi:hypothetical protein
MESDPIDAGHDHSLRGRVDMDADALPGPSSFDAQLDLEPDGLEHP